jgi:hypothetical protein
MSHFEREAKINVAFLLAIPLGTLLATLIGLCVFPVLDAARRSQCLERGGNFIPETRDCVDPAPTRKTP